MRCGMKIESVMNCASMSWSDWGLSMPLRPSTRPVFPSEETSRLEWPRNIVGAANRSKTARWGCFCPTLARLRHTLLDRELYLPRHWVEDRARCEEAGIPETVRFQTKCELARRMMERLHQAQVSIDWVVADSVYGNNLDLRTWLEDHGYWHVLAVATTEQIGIMTPEGPQLMTVKQAERLLVKPQDWQRLRVRTGTKGPLLFDWARVPILHQWQDDKRHWVLLRRIPSDPTEITYYLVFGPAGTTLEVMAGAIGARWCIEEEFENGKDLGLDHSEVRGLAGWVRHMTLVVIVLGSLESSWMYDPHVSNGLLYGARHRSQNRTQLAPTCQDAVLHLSDRCATQMLDVGASPAVSNPACSLSSDVPCLFPSAWGRSYS